MHSSWNRVSTIFSHASTALMVLLGLVAATSYLTLPSVEPGNIEIKNVHVYVSLLEAYKPNEAASLRFDLDVDLRPLFTWNTKQLFVYLVVDYLDGPNTTLPSSSTGAGEGLVYSKRPGNEIVVWDRIVTREREARLRIEAGKTKYTLRAVGKKFFGAEPFRARLMYNIMPWVGILSYGTAAESKTAMDWPRPKSV
ncbi:signal peptidase subunit [Dacryopinax primogenitus]|uniref:Signal peptidase subunit 3 n=1 Tax=Dacryopinax primogenitus (strain DJM 731) TaxID=1858805 RepID=M5FQN1_DACPD|nr:signal peptidase subunit [Dacryopinax primogenitus]EJT99215.1 signal peptidase subunit [Dacryopinax primogenitus]